MKNYFENETTILPFDKVRSIHKNKDSLYVCIGFDKGNGIGSAFPLDQLTNYKEYIDGQIENIELSEEMLKQAITTAKKQAEVMDYQKKILESQIKYSENPNSWGEHHQNIVNEVYANITQRYTSLSYLFEKEDSQLKELLYEAIRVGVFVDAESCHK